MSALRASAQEYLAMRRALGFKLTTQGAHLMSFVSFCEEHSAATVTTDLAVRWATSTASRHEAYQARRLDSVRISPGTCRHWTRQPRSRRWTCYPVGNAGSRLTFSLRSRSLR